VVSDLLSLDQVRVKEGEGCSLSRVAKIMVIADPNSIEKPREGEWRVMRLPRLRMMLYPYVHKPITIATPPKPLTGRLVPRQPKYERQHLQDPIGDWSL
jgi:hypothetical protein